MTADQVRWRLELDAARDRLADLARPCLVWGLVALGLFGLVYLHQLVVAVPADPLVRGLARGGAVGAVLWTLSHGAALWWLHHPTGLSLVLFCVAGTVGTAGVVAWSWSATSGHVLGVVAGLVVGGAVFAAEALHVARVLDLARAGAG